MVVFLCGPFGWFKKNHGSVSTMIQQKFFNVPKQGKHWSKHQQLDHQMVVYLVVKLLMMLHVF